MELPDSVKTIGDQIGGSGAITPPEELFEGYDVFAAEQTQVFMRPWVAVDHVSRLGRDGRWLRFDVGNRSVLVVRETADCIHALRNSCLHAGYRVCEDEDGLSEKLFCPYHGWFYALDGRLTDPVLRPDIEDRSRYRLARYAMQISRGLILVDMSAAAPTPPEPAPLDEGVIPEAFADGTVTLRKRYKVPVNWKYLRQLLRATPELVLPGAVRSNGTGGVVEFGPLSFLVRQPEEAALVRIIPRFPGQSDVDIVRVRLSGPAKNGGDDEAERVGAALNAAGDAISAAPLTWLDQDFYAWYWPLMAPAPVE
jgi:nitrite reductase/ring-hydroxylating ferredoxin subunit